MWAGNDAELVHAAAFAQWGACLGEAAVDLAAGPGELVFQAPQDTLPTLASEVEEVSPPPTPLVSLPVLEHFYNAVSRAERAGAFARRFGPVEVTGWIHLYEGSLEELEHLAGKFLRGDMSVTRQLHALLDGAPRLSSVGDDEQAHEHAAEGGVFARAHRPVDVVAAALVLDTLDGNDADTAARAVGLYATRIDALNRAFAAAERFAAGEIGAAGFEAAVVDAGPEPVDHHAHHGDGSAASVPLPPPVEVDAADLTPATRGLAHCLAVLAKVGHDLATVGDGFSRIETVTPQEACEGYDGTFSISGGGGSGLALWDGRNLYELDPVGERTSGLEVRPKQPLPAGTFALIAQPLAPSLRERLIDRALAEDPSCRPYVLQPPEAAPPSSPFARIAIIGDPTVRLTADGQEHELVAEAGADVVLEWEVRTEASGGARTNLRAGDSVLVVGAAAASGRLVVRAHSAATYTLSAEVDVDGHLCGRGEASVHVRRRGGGTLAVRDRVYRPGDPVTLEVTLAHLSRDDVEVLITSSDPEVLSETSVTVPAGLTTGAAYVYAGKKEGETTLGIRAASPGDGNNADDRDQLDDPKERRTFRVGRSSCVEPRYGGSWTTPTITVTDPGDPCPLGTALSNGGSDQLAFAGARLTDTASSVATIPDCWSDIGTKIDACSTTEAAEQAACDAAHASRTAGCTVTCTAFTNCDSIQCTAFTNCASITCTEFTNCNDFWVTDPRRYACWTARGVCVAAKALEQAACWVARGTCIAAAAVARAACVVARAACVAAAAVATGTCIAASAVVLAACKAVAWTKSVACKAAAGVVAIGCSVFKFAAALVLLAVAVVHIAVGVLLNTAAVLVGVGCAVVNGVAGAIGLGGTPASRTSTGLRIVGVHIAVLHTGRVLIFNYDEGTFPVTSELPANPAAVGDSDRALCVVWNPSDGTARYIPLARNLFCSGHAFTADGELFVAGGQFRLPGLLKSIIPPRELAPGADKDLHLFDPVGEGWRRLNDMEKGRWYPTCVTMADGKVMIASGTNAIATQAGFDGGIQHTWKIVDPATGEIGPDLGFNKQPIFHNYPFMLTLPSGEIFAHYKRITRFFRTPGGWGLMSAGSGGSYGGEGVPERTQYKFSRTGPGPGAFCLLPLIPTRDEETGRPRYPAGRILIFGGGGAEGPGEPKLNEPYELDPSTQATNTAEILDLDEAPLRWRWTGRNPLTPNPDCTTSPMCFMRVMPDPVLLPDATVLVVGGAQTGQSGGFLSHLRLAGGGAPMGASDPVQAPERFDPVLETWEALCPKRVERLYHATAALLPDGRVVVAGHDGFLNMPPADSSRYELELFSPPYLHRGPRPTVSSAPSRLSWGSKFTIATRDATRIASVCLIRQSSITHQTNTDQRYVGLLIEAKGDDSVTLHAPPDGGVAPPGFYMLFALTRGGVPSIAHWVQVGPPRE